jgi:AraC family transcriptional regulator
LRHRINMPIHLSGMDRKNRKKYQALSWFVCYSGGVNLRMRPTTLRFYKECLLRVLVHIQQHLGEPLALEELARMACLSPYHFHHVFTGMLGESLAEHVRRLRLEQAATQLKHSTTPVVQIAFDAGYETHESFTRAFRAAFGFSPTQFRQRRGVRPLLKTSSSIHYRHGRPPTTFRITRKKGKSMNVTIKRLEPMRVAFMRHVGPYDEVGQTWEQFTMLLGKDGFLGGNQFIGLSHDDPTVTPPDKLRYDACVTVDLEFRPYGEIGVQTIAGGDYAVLTHLGSYKNLGKSYEELLGQWLPRSGRRLRSTPCFEIYLNSPEDTEPEDLVTDIHAPLEP